MDLPGAMDARAALLDKHRQIGAREKARMGRRGFLSRYLGKACPCCGVIMHKDRGRNDPEAPSRDHRIPQSRGGSDDPENIIVICRGCNHEKNGLTVDEFIAVRAGLACRLDRMSPERQGWLWENPDVYATLTGHWLTLTRNRNTSARMGLATARAVLASL